MTRKHVSLSVLAALACGAAITLVSETAYTQAPRQVPCMSGFTRVNVSADFYRCELSGNVNEVCLGGWQGSPGIDTEKVGATGWKVKYSCNKKPG